MAKLFQRLQPVTAAVTRIPGEDEVDPDMLEQTTADPSTGTDAVSPTLAPKPSGHDTATLCV